MGNVFLYFFVDTGLYMGGVYKNFCGVYQLKFVAFLQDVGENLFKQIGILLSSGIVLFQSEEMGNPIHHFKSGKPTVSHIHFDLLNRLTHTSDSI